MGTPHASVGDLKPPAPPHAKAGARATRRGALKRLLAPPSLIALIYFAALFASGCSMFPAADTSWRGAAPVAAASANVPPSLPPGLEAISPSNAAALSLLVTWKGQAAHDLAWTPDGAQFAVAGLTGITLYDSQTLAPVRWIEDPVQVGVRSVAYSPDGILIASTSMEDRRAWIWRASDGKLLQELRGHADEIEQVIFSPDGRLLATASWDATIRVWSVSNGALVRELVGHTRDVYGIAFSPDGRFLLSGSWDQTVKFWHVQSGAVLATLAGHQSFVQGVSFSPVGTCFVTVSCDGTLRVWDAESKALRYAVQAGDMLHHVAWSPDGALLAASDVSGRRVYVWRASDGALLHRLEDLPAQVSGLAFRPDGRLLATTSLDGTVGLYGVRVREE